MKTAKTHYSQGGEDILLENIFYNWFRYEKPGFYIDVGAFHPYQYSNTMLLYERGWRGINIDARPGSKALFDQERPGDINLELAISDKKEQRTYFMLEEFPSANSLSRDFLIETGDMKKVARQLQLETIPLAEALSHHLPAGTAIDLLNVDVEGMDYQVLLSNHWERYRPKVVVVELMARTVGSLASQPAIAFLKELGYDAVAKTYLINDVGSIILVDKRQLP